ncbi:flagellar biosynthesis protein [Novosphingobium guangzhouense]|uniref:Flagellar assembly protein FliH n=1 Tax=Novosphingobium guangzhouense TaxID=1850347 RepID=A0A2K2G1D0_9SPHN|nr:flagellar biosynthesis protein [Novosphingobium guangzhouense]
MPAEVSVEGAATIQPFGFDRVFFHPVETPLAAMPGEPVPGEPVSGQPHATSAAEVRPEALRDRIAELEGHIARLQADHQAELARARADGFEAGAAQARGERGEALLAATDALHAALDGVEAQIDTVTRRLTGEAGALALHAAEMLAGHAIEATPARAVDEALARALDQVTQGTALIVRANPDMREEVAVLIEAREAKCGRPLAITVVEDPQVPEGDARIEWSSGGLNVDAQARRAAVMAELAGVLI